MSKTVKKITAILLSVLMVCSALAATPVLAATNVTAVGASSGKTGDCTWTLENGTLTISGNGKMGNYSAYEYIDSGRKMYGSDALWGYSFSKLVIENGVTSIGKDAFYGCTELTSVTIGNSVTSIGELAFNDCTGLTSVTIPNSVTSIGSAAFSGCTGLTSVTIPNSVTSIGYHAFLGCTGLTSVPDSLTSVGGSAFYNTAWFNNQPDGVVYAGKVAYIYKGTMPNNTAVVLKEGTTSIAGYAFYGCTGLTSVTIPDSVTSIGNGAFADTAWYNNQPDGVVYAGKVAYKYKGTMPNNTAVVLKEGTTSIVGYAFYGCTGLTSVTIPDSVTSIGEYAFYKCTGLTVVTIPDSVTSIGNNALGYYYDNGDKRINNFTIHGKKGSTAEAYANENGFDFTSHQEVIVKGRAATCTEDGLTDGSYCDICGEVIKEQQVIPALGGSHHPIVIPAQAATCTHDGHTMGSVCENCGEVYVAQTVIPKLPHTIVVDPARDATCTEDGLTEGSHCSVCGEVITAQTVTTPAYGHSYIGVPGTPATDSQNGLTDGVKCERCGEWLIKQEVIPKTGADVLIGDVNGDGSVNGADAGVLNRYASGWSGYADKIKNMAAADINNDGLVNGADAGILSRHVSGWTQYAKYFES